MAKKKYHVIGGGAGWAVYFDGEWIESFISKEMARDFCKRMNELG